MRHNRFITAVLIVALCAGSAFGQSNGRTATPITNAEPTKPLPVVVTLEPTDPTTLTAQQLLREITLVRDRMTADVAAVRDVITTRLDGMSEAVKLLQTFANKAPTTEAVALKVDSLADLTTEKFIKVDTQLLERKEQVEQTALAVKEAVGAALQAAKEAVSEQNKSNALRMDKSEAAFTKQIDSIGDLIGAQSKSTDDKLVGIGLLISSQATRLDEKIDDLKSRQNLDEGRSKGFGDFWGYLLAAVTIGFAAATFISYVAFNARNQAAAKNGNGNGNRNGNGK